MSRPLRIDYPNAWHHVMNRARRGTALFIDKTDFQQFISCVKDRFFKKKIDKEIPASKGLAPDLDRIISEVNRYYETRPAALTAVRRGIENEPRDVAIYLIRSMRSEPLMRIGARFGLNRYSSVSSVVIRANTKLQRNRKFKERLSHIESIFLKGQT